MSPCSADIASFKCFVQDPDIGGPGVRVSFYIQAFILVIIIHHSVKDATGALWTLIATSSGLMISAIIDHHYGTLTLFQAVQVNNLVWLANTCLIIGLAAYSRNRKLEEEEDKERTPQERAAVKAAAKEKRDKESGTLHHDFFVQGASMVEMFVSIILGVLLWAKSRTFEGDQYWQHTPYVFFWKTVLAANDGGRWCNIGFIIVFTLFYGLVTFTELNVRWKRWRERRSAEPDTEAQNEMTQTNGVPELPILPDGAVQPNGRASRRHQLSVPPAPNQAGGSADGSSISNASVSADDQISEVHKQRPGKGRRRRGKAQKRETQGRKRAYQFSDMDPFAFALTLCLSIAIIYFIVMNELLVGRHSFYDGGSHLWGFGQVLAVIAIAPSVISVAPVLRDGYRFVKRWWRKKKTNPNGDGMSSIRRTI